MLIGFYILWCNERYEANWEASKKKYSLKQNHAIFNLARIKAQTSMEVGVVAFNEVKFSYSINFNGSDICILNQLHEPQIVRPDTMLYLREFN